jgi:hypothetical protein
MEEEVRPTKVYKMTIMIIDHDRDGAELLAKILENTRYANDCMSPKVDSVQEVTVDWHDRHELNYPDKWRNAFRKLFDSFPF